MGAEALNRIFCLLGSDSTLIPVDDRHATLTIEISSELCFETLDVTHYYDQASNYVLITQRVALFYQYSTKPREKA